MISAIHKQLAKREEGFTLIELLVVVIIIGILAAIAIPTFLNQRVRGWEAAAVSDLRNAAIAQQSYYTGLNTYLPGGTVTTPAAVATAMAAEGFNKGANITMEYLAGGTASYRMCARNSLGGTKFQLNSTNGTIVRLAAATTAC